MEPAVAGGLASRARSATARHRGKVAKPTEVPLTHTFNAGQIEWYRAGSALNKMAKDKAAKV